MTRPETTQRETPMFWRKVLLTVALGKAAIAGAGAGLAILGAFDIAAAVTAREWLNEVQHAYALNLFAIGGGVTGAVGGLVKLILR